MHETDAEAVHTITTALSDGGIRVCATGDHYSLATPGDDAPTWALPTLLDHLEDCGVIPPTHDRQAVIEQVATHAHAQHLHQSAHLGVPTELVA